MEQQTINQQILDELKQIRTDINIIKQSTVDPDTILTSEEENDLDNALEEYKRDEAISLEEIEKERENA